MLKVGDKIKIKYCIDEDVEIGGIYEICSTQNSKYKDKELIMFKINNMPKWFLTNSNEIKFEIVKENDKMKELTFREVIANIKEGEVWESENFEISFNLEWNDIFIQQKNNDIYDNQIIVHRFEKFKLKRNKVSFQEAFKAFEEGKEIESCESNYKYYQGIDGYYIHSPYSNKGIKWLKETFKFKEIKGEWYINE